MTEIVVGAIDTPSRPWSRATLWLLALAPFFFLSYGAANWLASMHTDVGSVVFDWERSIPFIPWTIIPYWSIDVLYGISLFICVTERELDTHARRLLTTQIIAVICFILFPLTFTFARPEVAGLSGLLFDSLGQFDKPFNQAPSLHIALLVVLWDRFIRHVPARAGWIVHVWFALIGISVLTTYQHHFIDIPTGAALGFFCLWLWPDEGPGPLLSRVSDDPRRRRLAIYYASGALLSCVVAIWAGGMALWLFWLAIALSLVAVNYAVCGPAGFQKSSDGRMTAAANCLMAPYIVAAWINSRWWTRNDPRAVEVADNVSIGRLPRPGSPSDHAVLIDLCAELRSHDGSHIHRAFPMLDLIPPTAEQLRAVAQAIEQSRSSGSVLVCCALGYGRSAAAIAAWLLSTGQAADADAAIREVRRVRPRAVFSDAVRAAIAGSGARP